MCLDKLASHKSKPQIPLHSGWNDKSCMCVHTASASLAFIYVLNSRRTLCWWMHFRLSSCPATAGVSLYQPLSIKPHNFWYIFLQIAGSPLKASFFPYTSHYRDAFVTTNACTHIIPEIVFLHNVCLHLIVCAQVCTLDLPICEGGRWSRPLIRCII